MINISTFRNWKHYYNYPKLWTCKGGKRTKNITRLGKLCITTLKVFLNPKSLRFFGSIRSF